MNEFSAFGARSHSLAEALDHAVFLYRRNFGRLSLIAALAFIPVAVLRLIVTLVLPFALVVDPTEIPLRLLSSNHDFLTSSYITSVLAYLGLALVIEFVSYTVAVAAMIHLLLAAITGAPLSPLKSLAAMRKIWLKLLTIFGLKLVVTLLIILWSLVPVFGWLTGPGLLGFFLGVVAFLGIPVMVVEQQSSLRALARAWELARRRYGWLVLFACFLFIFSQVAITNGKYLIFVMLVYLVQIVRHWFLLDIPYQIVPVISFVVDTLASLIYLSFYAVAALTAYLYLRNCTEALDLICGLEVGSAESGLIYTASLTRPKLLLWLPTYGELWKFALTTISGTVGVTILYALFLGYLIFLLLVSGFVSVHSA
jgi:hypothetical protein